MLLFRLQESRPRVDGRGRLRRNHCSAVRRLFSEYFLLECSLLGTPAVGH